jgi:hypothetical protein
MQPTMTIIEPSPELITIKEAMHLSRVSDKLIRRALQRGALPRRYVLTARGPQLVFTRGELACWRAQYTTRRRTVEAAPELAAGHAALLDALRRLEGTFVQSHTGLVDLCAQLAQQQEELNGVRAAIGSLAASIAALAP